jgi:hypothetical protein
VVAVKPVVARMRGEILAGSVKAPGAIARDVIGQAEHTVRALYELVSRSEREELRLRAHPRDVLHHERYLGLMPSADDRSRVREQIGYLRAWLDQN